MYAISNRKKGAVIVDFRLQSLIIIFNILTMFSTYRTHFSTNDEY